MISLLDYSGLNTQPQRADIQIPVDPEPPVPPAPVVLSEVIDRGVLSYDTLYEVFRGHDQ